MESTFTLNKRENMFKVIFYLVGLCIMGLGIALNAISNFGAGPWDAVNIGLSYHINLSLMTGKIVSESSGLVIGLLLGGPIGLGSLIIVFAIGPMMQVLHKYTSNLFDKLTLKEELEMN